MVSAAAVYQNNTVTPPPKHPPQTQHVIELFFAKFYFGKKT